MPDTQHNRRDDVRATTTLDWAEPAPATVQLRDVMIDTETLGTKPGSAILSIGAVMFGASGLGDTFYAPIQMQSCLDVGLTVDAGTIAWWMRQSDAARAAAFSDRAWTLKHVLIAFDEWLTAQKAKHPWSHGAAFDIPLLDAAYQVCGLVSPWEFWDVRDTRTLYDLARVKIDRTKGTHHNALDDAKAQAEAAAKALNILQALPNDDPTQAMLNMLGRLHPYEQPYHGDEFKRRAYERLERAFVRQQPWPVPDQAAIVWRGDLIQMQNDLTHKQAVFDELVPALRHYRGLVAERAARDVLTERRRQVDAEGWTPEHDDMHGNGEIAVAAGYYALASGYPHEQDAGQVPPYWPWAASWWKPRDKRSNLVRAGALILAEIERLDRAATAPSASVDGGVK